MANRQNTFLVKRSSVPNKIPTSGQLLLGELALNTADVILYTSGTTANTILPIGWDRVYKTGDTMTGSLLLPTISATTYQNLPIDIRVTGGTYSNGTATFTNNTGGTFDVIGFSTGGSSGSTTTSTGTTTIDFGFPNGYEDSFATTAITNSNILTTSQVIYRVTPSTNHNEEEDSLLDGLMFKESNIVDGVGFTLNAIALNNTWGIYNITYKIIN